MQFVFSVANLAVKFVENFFLLCNVLFNNMNDIFVTGTKNKRKKRSYKYDEGCDLTQVGMINKIIDIKTKNTWSAYRILVLRRMRVRFLSVAQKKIKKLEIFI